MPGPKANNNRKYPEANHQPRHKADEADKAAPKLDFGAPPAQTAVTPAASVK